MSIAGLRKNKAGKQPKWTLAEISAGLEYFKELNGRYPSALEIDAFEYLPTSRSLQRTYEGGLVGIRTTLGFEESQLDYTKGALRSEKAKSTYKNAVDYEYDFYAFLISIIPEVQVHEHKILRPGNVCCDFFIYTSGKSGFAIDIFYAQDLQSLRGVVTIKTKRYANVNCKTFFVLVGNHEIPQEMIDSHIANKKDTFPGHLSVLTETNFKSVLAELL